jgi:hypothetical protein
MNRMGTEGTVGGGCAGVVRFREPSSGIVLPLNPRESKYDGHSIAGLLR